MSQGYGGGSLGLDDIHGEHPELFTDGRLREAKYHRRVDCRLCFGPYRKVLDLGYTALANEVRNPKDGWQQTYPLQLVHCEYCGHIQCPIVVEPKVLFSKYSYTSGLTQTYRDHLEKYWRNIKDVLPDDGLFVEIGGNDGTLGAKHDPAKYVNVDPSDVESPHGFREHAFFGETLACEMLARYGQAKVIVANHVFAHADNLVDMARGVRKLLADDGWFFCEVADGAKQLNSGCLDVIYHEHLSYHDARSFTEFMKKHGLALGSLSETPAQGGSLRFCFRKQGGPPIDIPEKLALNRPNPERIRSHAEDLHQFGKILNDLPSVAVFGAPAKLVTLMSLLGVSRKFKCVFDDSPRKIGRCVPGTHVPIVAPDTEHMAQYPHMLLASWNFEAEIRKRFKDYPGKWLVPCPNERLRECDI